MKTKDFRRLTPDTQESIRRLAVQSVLDGQKQCAAARQFGVSAQTVSAWMKRYHRQGTKALQAKPRGRKKGSAKLQGWQCAQIAKTVVDRCPEQAKLPGFWLWTREAVGALITRRFGVKYSKIHVGRLLARWGMTPQKPAKRALEQNPAAVKRWLDVEYPAIRKRANRENAEILWGDECGFRSDHQCGTTYGAKGKTPIVRQSGKRFSCNMISAIDNRGHMAFKMYEGSFSAPVFIDFMRRLIKQVRRKVFLIVDNLSVHSGDKVKKWVAKHAKSIRLFYLPKYSPDLNPDEYLNNDVKLNAVGRRRARNKAEFKSAISGYLRSTQRRPEVVKRLFQERHVRYAAL